MALSGDSATSVKYAAGHMKLQQDSVFMIGFVCISSFFAAAVSLSWARRPWGQAVLTTLIYAGSYLLLVVKGFQAHKLVNAYGAIDAEDTALLKKGGGLGGGGGGSNKENPSEVEDGYTSVKKSEHSHSHSHSEVESSHQHSHNRSGHSQLGHFTSSEVPPTQSVRAMGQLWFRESLDLGGQLHERFGVLQKGVLEIYRNERDFDKGKDAINEIPFQLNKYLLELDTKKFRRGLTSGRKSFRRLVSGQGEISLPVYVASEFDLKTAVKRFQFILYPKMLSEAHPLPVGEFMANDEQSYKQWVKALQTVIDSTQSLAQNNVVNRAMRYSSVCV